MEEQRRIRSWHGLREADADGGDALADNRDRAGEGVYGDAAASGAGGEGAGPGPGPDHVLKNGLPRQDPDAPAEMRRSRERAANKSAAEAAHRASKAGKRTGGRLAAPSVPPVQTPLIGCGVHHTVAEAMAGREGRKRRKVGAVKVVEIGSESIARAQRQQRRRREEEAKSK